jgi:hypothetical protein
MLARAVLGGSPYDIMGNPNACADARCHTPRREHFDKKTERNAKIQAFCR